jgi:hypothetical protein
MTHCAWICNICVVEQQQDMQQAEHGGGDAVRAAATCKLCLCSKSAVQACVLTSAAPATAAEVAESVGRDLLVYGRRMPKAELFARIDAVDADTVRAVADRFIYDQEVAMAAVGDTQFLQDYNWFRRRTYWLRY